MQRPVSIIGAGIAGLSLGQCLRSKGVPAIIFDKYNGQKRHDYGMTLHRNSYGPLLAHLRFDSAPFRQRLSIVENESFHDDLRANRWALEETLRDGLDIRYEHDLKFITPSTTVEKAVVLRFENDEMIETGLVVAADGVHSPTRKIMLPEVRLDVLPYVVFNSRRRVRRERKESVKDFVTKKLGMEAILTEPQGLTHYVGSTRLNITPCGVSRDRMTLSFTLSRPAAPEDKPLLERSIADADKCTEQFLEEIKRLGALPAPFDKAFSLEQIKKDRIVHWLMRSSLVGRPDLDKVANAGRVVLVGDAAHAQPILGGEGANMAMDDAVELATYLSDAGHQFDSTAYYNTRFKAWEKSRAAAEVALGSMHAVAQSARL